MWSSLDAVSVFALVDYASVNFLVEFYKIKHITFLALVLDFIVWEFIFKASN